MTDNYETPVLTDLGSLTELTEQSFNKVGSDPDTFSAIVPTIVGSITGAP